MEQKKLGSYKHLRILGGFFFKLARLYRLVRS